MFHNKDTYITVLTTLSIIEILICLAFNMYESFVTKITNDFMVNILMIVLIINSFIELYGIHKKRYWIIPFSCICKFSAMVYIIGKKHICLTILWLISSENTSCKYYPQLSFCAISHNFHYKTFVKLPQLFFVTKNVFLKSEFWKQLHSNGLSIIFKIIFAFSLQFTSTSQVETIIC